GYYIQMSEGNKRSYVSKRRQQNAEETRRRILASARRLIVSKGFGGAKIEEIANEAGVAVQTVYSVFGSKRGILLELHDHLAAEADLTALQAALAAAEGNPPQQLRERIAFNMRYYARGADLIEAARSASGVDQGLQEMWERGEARRLERFAELVAKWDRDDVLVPGLNRDEAVDIWWALVSPDMYRLLVLERKWDEKRFADWVFGKLAQLLFG
uniref:TetR/AcrR family transcriptional regulator n=1 Tax=Solirhodobacter olei TaxID=2493082 RepID=UPI0019D41A21